MIDFSICNKFLKKEVYLKALNLLNKYYLSLFITYYEDRILILYKQFS